MIDKRCCRYFSFQDYKKRKKEGYTTPTMNCYLRNGQLRDPDFTRHILYHLNQQQYSHNIILWLVLNISTIVSRTRLTRVQSQRPIKQVGLTIHSKTFLARNAGNIKYKTQKPCNKNPSSKSTELRQMQSLIEISAVLVLYS